MFQALSALSQKSSGICTPITSGSQKRGAVGASYFKKPDKGLKRCGASKKCYGKQPHAAFFSSPFFFFSPPKNDSSTRNFWKLFMEGNSFGPAEGDGALRVEKRRINAFRYPKIWWVGFFFFFFWLPLICHSGGFLPISRSRRIFLSCWEPWRGRCSFLLKSPSR